MTLRIRSDVSSINSHRNLLEHDAFQSRNFEKIASGLRIVRAADGPASLVLSEQMRSQIAGLKQAIHNTEVGISLTQTAESSLDEISRMLVNLRQLAVHASNEGANDEYMLIADQEEVKNILNSIDRIAEHTSFGRKKLLNGTFGEGGVASGEELQYISGGKFTRSSGNEMYQVKITQMATRSSITSEEITQEILDDGETFTISDRGKSVKYTSETGKNLQQVVGELNAKFETINMKIKAQINDENKINLISEEFGSEHVFMVATSSNDIFGDQDGNEIFINNGLDVAGTIGGYKAEGKGRYLTGTKGTPVNDLKIKYSGDQIINDTEEGDFIGSILFEQQGQHLQIGDSYGEHVKMSIKSMFSHDLARAVENSSNYKSLNDIDLLTFEGAQDALLLIEQATNDVSDLRGKLGAFQRDSLESELRNLRVAEENTINAESVIRDADIARIISENTKKEVLKQAAISAVAHSGKSLQSIAQLLSN